ncbi:MAG TPA: AAA family ATPase [Solirubrobacteraceae bacterium]|nr:AAA family ATPase [Solirubrobacteraceae bacterium]
MALAVEDTVSLRQAGLVSRSRLLDPLERPEAPRSLLLTAPAGYGKTALLGEWAQRASEQAAWLTLQPWHDDRRELFSALLGRMATAEPLGEEALEWVQVPAGASGERAAEAPVLPVLARALQSRELPLALVVDDVHVLSAPGALAVLAALIEHLPQHWRLALGSRSRPPLPLGRMRTRRELVELSAADLALSVPEAVALLDEVAGPLGDEQVERLAARAEGWPAALYLAALALRDAPTTEPTPARFCGSEELLAEYVREELLEPLTPEQRDLLVRSSVCEQLTPPLCDALRSRGGSASVLEALARGPLPFQALEGGGERYRAHPLVRDVLRAELRRAGAQAERRAHARARRWHESVGEVDAAISHAIEGEVLDAAGALMWEHLSAYIPLGRNEELQAHLRALTDEQIATTPPLAAAAAHSALWLGDLRRAERYASAASVALARDPARRPAASLRAGIAAIAVAVARGGMAPMVSEAERAQRSEDGHGRWQPTFELLLGVCAHLTAERATARLRLESAVHDGAVSNPPIEMLCLAQLALISAEEDDLESALIEVRAARELVERNSLQDYPIAALCFAVSAELSSRAGALSAAKQDAVQATALLARLGEFISWYGAECRISLARAELRLGEMQSARALLAQASRLARRVPDASVLTAWLEQAWAEADAAAAGAMTGSAALTLAELRVLRFLPTHLSFREIAERLHVSTNTVKTQVHAVYRKLGARSRSQAVARAASIGLLDG